MTASSLFPDLPSTPEEGRPATSFGATQSLYRKYRPQTFDADELVGQDAIVRTLKNAIRLDRVAPPTCSRSARHAKTTTGAAGESGQLPRSRSGRTYPATTAPPAWAL